MKLVENEWERRGKKTSESKAGAQSPERQDGEAVHQASAQREEGNRAGVRREKKPHQNRDKAPQNHKTLMKN